MKKALVLIAAVALIAWIISWFRAPQAVATSAARPWPGGRALNASQELRPQQANAAAVKLAALANALPKNDAIRKFVAREVRQGELTVGEPPAMSDVSAIRELLLREPIVWNREVGIGGGTEITAHRAAQMTMARALVASALTKARANDRTGWDDLLAVWKLARSLDGHPQVMSQTAAFSMARMINAVAWKMPLPPPLWFAELQARDTVPPLLESFRFQTAWYAQDGSRLFPTKMLANSVDADRAIAEAVAGETRCAVTPRANELGVDLTNVWRRAFRYRAEREATANALRVREGKAIETSSRCSDGAWTFDGTTLRFTRDIAPPASDAPMPLVLRLRR